MRPVALILAGSLTALALAAPVPRPGEWQFAPGLDRPIDPDSDCKFTFGKGALTIEVPGKPHDIDPARKRNNAPRALRDVEGDFRIEVRVRGDFDISEAASAAGVPSSAGAGLLVVADEKRGKCLRLEFGVSRDDCQVPRRYLLLKDAASGDAICVTGLDEEAPAWPYPDGATTAHLKLEFRHRKGGCQVRCFDSRDGKKWDQWNSIGPAPFPGVPKKLRAGVVACSTSANRHRFTFDQFKLTPLPAERPPDKKDGEK